jgi:hypothetical protein
VIRWKRSVEGYCDSHCGRWRISPLYCGRVKPQFFDLYLDGKKVALMLSSQHEAKDRASNMPHVTAPSGCYIDPDGNARPILVAGIHMECPICGQQPLACCISMAKRYSGDYGCRGRTISLPSWARDRKTFHKERVQAAKVESDRRKLAASEYNARRSHP